MDGGFVLRRSNTYFLVLMRESNLNFGPFGLCTMRCLFKRFLGQLHGHCLEQLSGQWFGQQAKHEMIICCFQFNT